METVGRNAPIRATIVLEGGGRLEDVAQIVEIRLEPEHVEVRPAGDGSVEVCGAINAYIYCLRPRGRGVEGEGFRIPFTHRVVTGGLDPGRLSASLERLDSEHDFNPITGDFHHRVTAVLLVAAPQPAAAPKERESAATTTQLSQVRTGELPSNERRLDGEAAGPAANRPASAEEFESLRRALARRERSLSARAEAERPQEERPEPVQAQGAPAPAPGSDKREAAGPAPARSPLVWKPFPPPIAGQRRPR